MTEQFKQFKIGELFTVTSGKWLSKVDQKPGKTPFISSSAKNNGIMTYINKKPLFPANTITVASHGSVGAAFFQTVPYYASSNVNSLSYKNGNLSEKVGLYFVAAIQHVSKNYGFSHILSVTRTKQMEIMLPVTPAGEPDFAYMTMRIRELEAERIRELEAERIRELEAYLHVTGFDDTTLSAGEAQALKQKVQWKKFRIGDMFEIHPTRAYKLTNRKLMDENGKTPVLTNTSTNNGIGGWSNLEPTEKPLMITYSDTTTGADTVFVQTKPFIGYSHVQGLYSKINHEWTIQELLYIAGVMKAAIGDGWSYATKLNREIVSNLDFMLPVTSTGDIDFNYMRNYIRATEKQIIKGVVEYKDRVIEETKKVVTE